MRQTVSDNRAGRAAFKTVFRTFNAVPPLKRRVFAGFGDS